MLRCVNVNYTTYNRAEDDVLHNTWSGQARSASIGSESYQKLLQGRGFGYVDYFFGLLQQLFLHSILPSWLYFLHKTMHFLFNCYIIKVQMYIFQRWLFPVLPRSLNAPKRKLRCCHSSRLLFRVNGCLSSHACLIVRTSLSWRCKYHADLFSIKILIFMGSMK